MTVAALALLGLTIAAGPSAAGEHVLAGARLFREERWAEALVEFKVAERLGDRGARSYAAAALVKLDRPEQAVEEFEAAGAPRAGRDALLDYYHAVAAHDARLYLRAERLLAAVGERAGPRIAEQARKVRLEVAALLAREPAREAVDWYLARCDELAGAGRAALARAFCEEARDLGERRGDRHGVPAATARLEKLHSVAEAR
jgi:hypothetical protein